MYRILNTGAMALFAFMTAGHGHAVEIDLAPSGFVDFIWTVSDGTEIGKYGDEGHFDTTGELDVEAAFEQGVSVRMDADINPSSAGSDSARLEQIFLKWDIDKNMSLTGGVFNNRLTFEREDAPDLYQVTHGQLWDIWNVSTVEDGNNLQGVEFSFSVDSIELVVGYLNDLDNTVDENSLEVAVGISTDKGLDVTLGLITQDHNLETIFDLFASYRTGEILLAGEVLLADEQIDNGIMLMANLRLAEKISATVRYDIVSYEDNFLAEDTSSLTFAGIYDVSKNLHARGEIRVNDDDNNPVVAPLVGEGDGTTARLEFLATF